MTLQPGPEDTGKACGVDYELQTFCAKAVDEKIHQRNSVHLIIRKVQYAPEKPGPQPMAEASRNFLMSDRSLHLEASLDKEVNYSPFTAQHNGSVYCQFLILLSFNIVLVSKNPHVWLFSLQLYYHGEPINVNVHVTNNSTKTVKRIKASGNKHSTPTAVFMFCCDLTVFPAVRQYADICLFSAAQYMCPVAQSDAEWVNLLHLLFHARVFEVDLSVVLV